MNKKIQTSLRMSQEAKRLLKQLSESAIIELAIRKLAKQEGCK
jgi:predicted DNA-binding protein